MVAERALRVLLAGGGTGGHLYPALRIAEGLRKAAKEHGEPEPVIAFIGNPEGIEAEILKDKETFYPIRVSGFHRGGIFSMIKNNMGFFWKLLHVKTFQPDVVVGTGGYVSGPPLLAATRKGIPTVIQEQNSYPGITTRLLAKRVDEIHVSYQDAADRLDSKKKIHMTGNPVQEPGVDMEQSRAKLEMGFQQNTFLTTVIGGSQGAEPINRHLVEHFQWYQIKDGLSLLWQCGIRNLDRYIHLQTEDGRIQVTGFISDMHTAYAASDLVIGRAGALTISELAMAGKPAILIPLPTAAANHQYYNAKSYEQHGAAIVVEQNQLAEGRLEETIARLQESPEELSIMASCARGQARPDATRQIINTIYTLAEDVVHVQEV